MDANMDANDLAREITELCKQVVEKVTPVATMTLAIVIAALGGIEKGKTLWDE